MPLAPGENRSDNGPLFSGVRNNWIDDGPSHVHVAFRFIGLF
jgi:hypothetical protein